MKIYKPDSDDRRVARGTLSIIGSVVLIFYLGINYMIILEVISWIGIAVFIIGILYIAFWPISRREE